MNMDPLFSYHSILRAISERTRWRSSFVADAAVFAGILGILYAVVVSGRIWFSPFTPVANISGSPRALPLYAAYSLVRIVIAYLLALVFALAYGLAAAKSDRAAKVLLPLLDILQSIPVLSFLPGVMLAMVSLFPEQTSRRRARVDHPHLHGTGLEHGLQLLLVFEVDSARIDRSIATIYRFGKWQRFFQLELPYGAIGLIWNSIVSVAGGWFFLMACEMFVLGKRDFRLPGLGSYLQTAAGNGDTYAMIWGLVAMIGVILLIDQLIWRPAIAWSNKFKFEQVESTHAPTSPLLHLLRNSRALNAFREKTVEPLGERINLYFARRRPDHPGPRPLRPVRNRLGALLAILAIAGVGYEVFRAFALLRGVTATEFKGLMKGAGATFLRVNVSLLLASAWTIPAGVAIGFNPKLARIMQPVTQIAASVPATALFPVLLLGIVRSAEDWGWARLS